MSSLSHYHIGSTILICPRDKTGPVIEAIIKAKAQGRGKQPSRVKVQVPHPLDIFGDKHKSEIGVSVNPSDTSWLSPAEWDVVGKVAAVKS